MLHVKSYVFSVWMYSKYKRKKNKEQSFCRKLFNCNFRNEVCIFFVDRLKNRQQCIDSNNNKTKYWDYRKNEHFL